MKKDKSKRFVDKLDKLLFYLMLTVFVLLLGYIIRLYQEEQQLDHLKRQWQYQLHREIVTGKRVFVVGNMEYTPLADGSWIVRSK